MAKKTLGEQFTEKGDFVGPRHPVKIPRGKGELELFIRELGYLELQDIYATARVMSKSAIGLLVAACVEDVEGVQFSYEEVMRLKDPISSTLFFKVAEIQRIGEGESAVKS